CQHYYSTPLTS
nr:immunoglobulin light chain junction region [Macaca mulatta]